MPWGFKGRPDEGLGLGRFAVDRGGSVLAGPLAMGKSGLACGL